MSMNATHVSTMIFSDDQLKAESKMNELIRYLPKKTIIRRKKDYVKTVIGTYQAKSIVTIAEDLDIKKSILIKLFGTALQMLLRL